MFAERDRLLDLDTIQILLNSSECRIHITLPLQTKLNDLRGKLQRIEKVTRVLEGAQNPQECVREAQSELNAAIGALEESIQHLFDRSIVNPGDPAPVIQALRKRFDETCGPKMLLSNDFRYGCEPMEVNPRWDDRNNKLMKGIFEYFSSDKSAGPLIVGVKVGPLFHSKHADCYFVPGAQPDQVSQEGCTPIAKGRKEFPVSAEHSMLLTGMKAVGNKCYYRLRNSNGPSFCENQFGLSPDAKGGLLECDHKTGDIWISEGAFMDSVGSVDKITKTKKE